MAKYVNEFMELRAYRDLAVRNDELITVMAHLDWDRNESWCDEELELEQLRHDAYVAVKKYDDAIQKRMNAMTDELYNKLDFADTFKPKKRFWDIFKRKGS